MQAVIGIFLIGIAITFLQSTEIAADDRDAVRDDALKIMGAASWVPGAAAYCNKYVESDPDIIAAAIAWNERHQAALEKTIEVIKWTGGLSNEEKVVLDKAAMSALRTEFGAQSDSRSYCRQIALALDRRILDLSNREDTAPALRRILDLQLRE